MADMPRGRSELWRGVRRGTGWALGVGAVVSVAGLLRDGPRKTIKGIMKAGMRGQEVAAELSEQAQDLYAEARFERAAEPPAAEA